MTLSGDWIQVRGARTHNLHNVNVDLPRERLIVLTGPSGSGKSSLAFDTIHAEGQRRYLETLRTDTRALFAQLQRPDVDLVDGLPPTLCVAQQTGTARPRSTLATVTEIHDHLRLLWARLGVPHCYQCGTPLHRHSLAEIVRQTLALEEGRKVYLLAPLVQDRPGEHKEAFGHIRQNGFLRARVDGALWEIRDIPHLNPRQKHTIEMVVDRLVVRAGIAERLEESLETAVRHGQGVAIVTNIDDGDWHDRLYHTRHFCSRCQVTFPDPEPRRFSFNNPYGACPNCNGLGQVWDLDAALVIPDATWTLAQVLHRLHQNLPPSLKLPVLDCSALARNIPHPSGQSWNEKSSLADWPGEARTALLQGTDCLEPPFPGLLPPLRQALAAALAQEGEAEEENNVLALAGFVTCPECGGARLNREARAVLFAGQALHQVTASTVAQAAAWFSGLEAESLGKEPDSPPADADSRIRSLLLTEILTRLRFLEEVGLGYLTLDRPAPTLSGGEMQRARLATHLGGGLLGVCYVLDEPTVGLHPRDTDRLIGALRHLQQRGNTVIVVEHDEAVMRQADYLVDMGPGAGQEGGHVLACGSVAEVLANPGSVTARYLSPGTSAKALSLRESWGQHEGQGPALSALRPGKEMGHIIIRGARHHNLKNLTVSIPLGRLVCLTGVSGSGKSTLGRDILCHAARRRLGLQGPQPGAHDGIDGLDQIDKIIEVDQAPLGRSSRSSAATYTGIFDDIRKVFAATRLAKVRGYKANRFSFNVRGGRCEECQGQGALKVAMQFLPELTVPCPLCHGQRFNQPTMEIRYRDCSIAEVLELSVAAALEMFANIPSLVRPLQALADVGLGYLRLGQPSSALSGGEAQRVKLAAELARTSTGHTLFLLDEPTTGLHFADVANLLRVLGKLVEAGNTLLVIEHHLDVIAHADWLIDLGPEGGAAGGYLVAAGPPAAVAQCPDSITGHYLRPRLENLPH